MTAARKRPGFKKFLGLPLAIEVSVGAVVFRAGERGREYLLLHYPNGHWDYVKGHVEEGESHEETLRREALEEAGLADLALIPGYHEKTRYYYAAKGREREKRAASGTGRYVWKTVHFYLAETVGREVALSHEHVGAVWLPYQKALRRLTYENARELIRRAETHLRDLGR